MMYRDQFNQFSGVEDDELDFTQAIISWGLKNQFMTDEPVSTLTPLRRQSRSVTSYCNGYIPLVLEDARAVIFSGLRDHNAAKFSLRLSERVQEPRTLGNPWIMKFNGSIKTTDGESCYTMNVLLLTRGNFKFIATASDYGNGAVKCKARISTRFFEENDRDFDRGAKWEAKYLGSLVSHERMYNACLSLKEMMSSPNQLITNIINGTAATSPSSLAANTPAVGSLNESQTRAVQDFLSMPNGNIMLLQGPPGTGKTTTVTTMLEQLYRRGKRTLVCAPSNKAVHVLAIRFLEQV